MTISSLGIGSGLDLNSILTSLMEVEQQPLVALQKKELSYQSRISSLGTLRSALASLQSTAATLAPDSGKTAVEKYQTLRATSSDSSIATATVSSGAIATSYSLTNITLAKAEQIRKSGNDLSIPAAGNGTLTIQVGSADAVDVAVTGGSSLSQIATAINDAKAGVTAAVINDGTTDHLVLTADASGAANTLKVTGGSGWESFDYSTGTANSWTLRQAATSASVDINGLTVTSDTNTIENSISGVSISLLKESSTGTSLGISKDNTTNLTSALTTFVKAYNAAAATIKELGAYNAETKVAGALQGDSTWRSAQSQVRNMLLTTAGGSSAYQTLSDLGVAIQADGSLKLDTTKLNKAISADFDNVAAFVGKIGQTFNSGIDSLIGTTGTLTSATDNTNRVIKDLQSRQAALEVRLEQTQARYQKQFAALDTMLSGLNSTSSWLTQQLASLPGAYSGNNN